MGLTVEDGKGNGHQAEVDSHHMLHVHSVSESLEHYANSEGNSYNIVFSQIADTTGSCILYVKNGFEENIIIEGIILRSDADEIVDLRINDAGSPISGLDINPVNLNAGSGRQAEGIFQGGSNITGLAGGSLIFDLKIKGNESSKHYNFDQDVFLPKNRVLTICCQNGGISVHGIFSFFRETLD